MRRCAPPTAWSMASCRRLSRKKPTSRCPSRICDPSLDRGQGSGGRDHSRPWQSTHRSGQRAGLLRPSDSRHRARNIFWPLPSITSLVTDGRTAVLVRDFADIYSAISEQREPCSARPSLPVCRLHRVAARVAQDESRQRRPGFLAGAYPARHCRPSICPQTIPARPA